MFTSIGQQPTAVDACERALREAIVGGQLAPGERLPPERQLAATFGVGRVTVRSALGRLEHARLLSVRQGSGYVVRDYRHESGPELLGNVAQLAGQSRGAQLDIVTDLLRVRRHLARAVLERLVEHPPSPRRFRRAIAHIRTRIDAFEQAVHQGDDQAIANADLEVVRAIVDATDSAVMQLCMNPIERALLDLPELRRAMYHDPSQNIAGWRALSAWLEHLAERPRADAEPDAKRITLGGLDAMLELLVQRDTMTIARLRGAFGGKR